MDVHEMRALAGLEPLSDAPMEGEIQKPKAGLEELKVRMDIATSTLADAVFNEGFEVPEDYTRLDLIEAVEQDLLSRQDIDEAVLLDMAGMVMELRELAEEIAEAMAWEEQANAAPANMNEAKAVQIIRDLYEIAVRNNYEVDLNKTPEEFVKSLEIEYSVNPQYFQAPDRTTLSSLFESSIPIHSYVQGHPAPGSSSDAEGAASWIGKKLKHGAKKLYHVVRGFVKGLASDDDDKNKRSSYSPHHRPRTPEELEKENAELRRAKERADDIKAHEANKQAEKEREAAIAHRYIQTHGMQYHQGGGYGHPGGYGRPY